MHIQKGFPKKQRSESFERENKKDVISVLELVTLWSDYFNKRLLRLCAGSFSCFPGGFL